MNKRGLIIAAAAAALFTSGVYAASNMDSNSGQETAPAKVEKSSCNAKHTCKGKNTCKGKHHCKGKNHCKGTNSCKGKGTDGSKSKQD